MQSHPRQSPSPLLPSRTSYLSTSSSTSTQIPLAPPSSTPNQNVVDITQSSVRNDLHKAFNLLRRSPQTQKFMLSKPSPSFDLSILASPHPRPSFTITTEEVQSGSLPGLISLHYLGIPSFPDVAGLSGGLVVTIYANRNHPLHDPAVMSDLRVGRYVRDNQTGEWCIITRNQSDGILRLQYMGLNDHGQRERIGLTCDIRLFDQGKYIESVLYKCHDYEKKVCHRCACSKCLCHENYFSSPSVVPYPQQQHYYPRLGLDTVAQKVVREGADDWIGTVRVTVVSNFAKLSKNPLLNVVDDTMTVHSSYQPALDKRLAARMQRQAIMETISQYVNVPSSLTFTDGSNSTGNQQQESDNDLLYDDLSNMLIIPSTSSHSHLYNNIGKYNEDTDEDDSDSSLLLVGPPSPATTLLIQQRHNTELQQQEKPAELSPVLQLPAHSLPLTMIPPPPPPLSPILPPPVTFSPMIRTPLKQTIAYDEEDEEEMQQQHQNHTTDKAESNNNFTNNTHQMAATTQSTPKSSPQKQEIKLVSSTSPLQSPPDIPFTDMTFDDVFFPTHDFTEVADHFLIPYNSLSTSTNTTEVEEDLMLPADPSTLPAGIESCMDGMNFDGDCMYEDDCFSLMTSDRDTRSMTSALSTAGSDIAPKLDSVPLPGDDVLDAISALQLSSPSGQEGDVMGSPFGVEPPLEGDVRMFDNFSSSEKEAEKEEGSEQEKERDEEIKDKVENEKDINVVLEPINEPMDGRNRNASARSLTGMSEIESDEQDSSLNVTVKEEVHEAEVGSQPDEQRVVVDGMKEENGHDEMDVLPQARIQAQIDVASVTQQQKVKQQPVKMEHHAISLPTSAPVPQPAYVATGGVPMYGVYRASGMAPAQVRGSIMSLPVTGHVMVPGSMIAGTPNGMMGATAMVPATSTATAPGGLWMLPTATTAATGAMQQAQSMFMGCPFGEGVAAPRLAPRPEGVSREYVSAGMGIGGGLYGDARVMMAMEKERKAEERRKKNRQAAARSNARKKDLMDGIKAEIEKTRHHERALHQRRENLKRENGLLKQRLSTVKGNENKT